MDESADALDLERDQIVIVETNLDNVTGELLGALLDRLLAAGALDVNYVAMQMKKNRPATLVRVLARPEDAERLAALLLRETPTLGVRLLPAERRLAGRRQEVVATPLGPVAVKLKLLGGRVVGAAPEFADCQRLAGTTGLPLADVTARLAAWLRGHFQLDD